MAATTPRFAELPDRATNVPRAPSRAPRGHHVGGRRLWAALGALALVVTSVTAGYVAGRAQAWSSNREAQVQLQVAVQEHERAFDHARSEHLGQLVALRRAVQRTRDEGHDARDLNVLYEGGRRLQHALSELDEGNFGTAQNDLTAAQRLLTPLAARDADLPKLLHVMSATKLAATGDSSQQRNAVASLVRAFDRLLDAELAAR